MDVLVDEFRYDQIPIFADQQECRSGGRCHGPIDIDTARLGERIESVGSKQTRHSDERGENVPPNLDGERRWWKHVEYVVLQGCVCMRFRHRSHQK